MVNLFLKSFMELNLKDKSSRDSMSVVMKDIAEQVRFTDPEVAEKLDRIPPFLDSYSLTNTNKLIEELSKQNYYFPDKSHLLGHLHQLLVEKEFIEKNANFKELFEKKQFSSELLTPIKWLAPHTIRELLYLLYLINNKNIHHKGISIATIAFNLFTFEGKPVEASIRAALSQIQNKFNDYDYISKNMNKVLDAVKELKLL